MKMKRRLFEIHHRIKLKLDAICQEAGDMNTEEFMKVYEALKYDSSDSTESELDIIELRNANKLAHERIKQLEANEIKPWSNDKRILETLQENIKLKERNEQLEQQVAKYDFLD